MATVQRRPNIHYTYSGLPQPAPTPTSGLAPIQAPKRTTIQDSYQNIQSLLPKPAPVNFTPITGYDDNYYKTLSDQASKRLRQQYFTNSDSSLNQLTNIFNKRGLIGSGIEAGGLSDLYKDFGSQMADVESNLGTERARNDLNLSQFNTTTGLDTAFKNQDMQNRLVELGLSAAGDEAANATKFDTGMFDSAIKQKNAEQDYIAKILAELNTAQANQLTDKDTRQIFENYFGSQIGDILGRPEGNNSFNNDQQTNDLRDEIRRLQQQINTMPKQPVGMFSGGRGGLNGGLRR